MSQLTVDPPRVRLDEAGRIGQDLPCVGCGYNLRMQRPDQACPECGRAVRDSLGQRLTLTDPAWLREMGRGLVVMLAGTGLGAVLLVAMVATMSRAINAVAFPAGEIVVWAFAMPPGLVIAAGVWLLTRPEKDAPAEPWALARPIARWSAMALMGTAVATLPAWFINENLALASFGVGCLAAVVFGFAALAYGRWLALRVPARSLAALHAVLAGAYVVLLAGWLTGLALAWLLNSPGGFGGGPFDDRAVVVVGVLGFFAWMLLAAATGLLTLVTAIWDAWLFFRLARPQRD